MSEVKKENPLLSKIKLPGKRFRLPSRGLFYTNGELKDTVQDGEVEVLSMSTIDEINLRSPDYLFSGEAIEKVFKRCIPEVEQPLKLLSPDVDFLLTALRIVSYGEQTEIETRCPKCEERQNEENKVKEEEFIEEIRQKAAEQEVEFDVAMASPEVQKRLELIRKKKVNKETYRIDLNGILTNKTTEMEPEEFEKYSFTLSNGQDVQIIPFRFDSAVMAFQYQNEDFDRDLDKVGEYISFLIASSIQSVDGVTDQEQITEWVKSIPISLKDEINKKMEAMKTWGTDFNYQIKCSTCGHERNASALLNPITFFMKPSELEEDRS